MNNLLKGLTPDQRIIMGPYATIQIANDDIMLLSTQYVAASVNQNKAVKKKCADSMVERAKVLLDAAEKLAKVS